VQSPFSARAALLQVLDYPARLELIRRVQRRTGGGVSLVRLKLRVGGPHDLMDAAHPVLQHPDHIDRAREAARAYHIEDRLGTWLNDPRTRSRSMKTFEAVARRADKSSSSSRRFPLPAPLVARNPDARKVSLAVHLSSSHDLS
jgi:hypothetical protein